MMKKRAIKKYYVRQLDKSECTAKIIVRTGTQYGTNAVLVWIRCTLESANFSFGHEISFENHFNSDYSQHSLQKRLATGQRAIEGKVTVSMSRTSLKPRRTQLDKSKIDERFYCIA